MQMCLMSNAGRDESSGLNTLKGLGIIPLVRACSQALTFILFCNNITPFNTNIHPLRSQEVLLFYLFQFLRWFDGLNRIRFCQTS
jgi:hypothetical protein